MGIFDIRFIYYGMFLIVVDKIFEDFKVDNVIFGVVVCKFLSFEFVYIWFLYLIIVNVKFGIKFS